MWRSKKFDLAIYSLLQTKNWSAKDLAKASGVNETHLSDWRSGRKPPKLRGVYQLARAFGVGIEAVMGGTTLEDLPPKAIPARPQHAVQSDGSPDLSRPPSSGFQGLEPLPVVRKDLPPDVDADIDHKKRGRPKRKKGEQ